jgi:F-type H+-transporting ATPase subunit delta
MRFSALAYRYASAIFDVANEAKSIKECLIGLQALEKVLSADKATHEFVASPLIRTTDKEAVIQKITAGSGLPKEVIDFALLLARKNRLMILDQIVAAFQAKDDELQKVTRGTVRSASPLTAKQKEDVEKKIASITNKKVSLQYTEDKSLIGGLVAHVGSYTFDDSLTTHLRRIKEDLTRRIN